MQSTKSGVSRVLGLSTKLISMPKAYIRSYYILTVILYFDYKFITKELKELALKKGIIYTTSTSYTSEQKEAREYINRTLFNKIRILLYIAKLLLKF